MRRRCGPCCAIMKAESSRPAILIESLVRDFGAVRALDHLSLEVAAGTLFGFLGPNGAGKTTVIRTLLGLIEPTAGRAEVLGIDVATRAAEVRVRCGALLEHPGLYERLSAEDNLEFFGRIWGMKAADRRERTRELLTQFGLWERRREAAGRWSRGMKQKLSVARAVFHRPSLVFLDEPTSGLDPVATVGLREDLSSLVDREGVTVFLTTHNLAEAERLCSQVGVIQRGRLAALGKPGELRASAGRPRLEIVAGGVGPELMDVLRARPEVDVVSEGATPGMLAIGLRGDPSVAPIVELLVRAGVAVEEVRKVRPTFEEAFLDLVTEPGGVS